LQACSVAFTEFVVDAIVLLLLVPFAQTKEALNDLGNPSISGFGRLYFEEIRVWLTEA
jgi:hypothetical protein